MVCLEFSRHLIKGGWSQQNLWHFAVGFNTPNMYMLVTTEQNELDPLCEERQVVTASCLAVGFHTPNCLLVTADFVDYVGLCR